MRALLVSYAFPPTGGAGVGRALKLVKYLPRWGVDVTVLTVKNPSVPVTDESLAADIPGSTRVIRMPSLEPSYSTKASLRMPGAPRDGREGLTRRLRSALASAARQALVPDPQLLWQPGAVAGLAVALRERPDVVLLTAPPFSVFLLAPLVRFLQVPVIFDYRDEWSTLRSRYENHSGAGSARIGAALEGALIRTASRVVVATEGFRDNLLARFPTLDPASIVTIPNGFDPDDLPEDPPEPPADRLTLTYAGTVFRLTRCHGLLSAIRELAARDPSLGERLRVRFVGRIVEAEKAAFVGLESAGVELHGYVPKARAIELCAGSHVTLCTLDDLEENRRIYPAKIFELMALGRPCWTIAPDGVLTDLARRHRLGPVSHPTDVRGMVATLERALMEFQAGTLATTSTAVDIEKFHRGTIARSFAQVFRSAVGGGGLGKSE